MPNVGRLEWRAEVWRIWNNHINLSSYERWSLAAFSFFSAVWPGVEKFYCSLDNLPLPDEEETQLLGT